ncbi:MAG: hypothetical protein M3P53_06325 [Actinomycetota bacterium]|nr:hypothetical protein [Actinomycetota bacterium]
MPPVRPLIDFLRSVAAQPAEHGAFRRDPEGYLASHGYEGIHRDDATDAMSLVADTLPAAVAARLIAEDRAPLELVTGAELERDLDDVANDGVGREAPWAFEGEDGVGFGLAGLDDQQLDDPSFGHQDLDDPGLDDRTIDQVTLDDLALDDLELDDVALDHGPDDDVDIDDISGPGSLPLPEGGESSSTWYGTDLDIGAF